MAPDARLTRHVPVSAGSRFRRCRRFQNNPPPPPRNSRHPEKKPDHTSDGRQKKPRLTSFFPSAAIKMELGQGLGNGGEVFRCRRRSLGAGNRSAAPPRQRHKVMLVGARVISANPSSRCSIRFGIWTRALISRLVNHRGRGMLGSPGVAGDSCSGSCLTPPHCPCPPHPPAVPAIHPRPVLLALTPSSCSPCPL